MTPYCRYFDLRRSTGVSKTSRKTHICSSVLVRYESVMCCKSKDTLRLANANEFLKIAIKASKCNVQSTSYFLLVFLIEQMSFYNLAVIFILLGYHTVFTITRRVSLICEYFISLRSQHSERKKIGLFSD